MAVLVLLLLCSCKKNSQDVADAAFDEAIRKHKEMVSHEEPREEQPKEQQVEDGPVSENDGGSSTISVIPPIPPIK